MNDLVDRVQVLNVQAGDILVFRINETLTQQQCLRFNDQVKEILAKANAPECPCIILQQGMDLEVLRPLPGTSPFITRAELQSMGGLREP